MIQDILGPVQPGRSGSRKLMGNLATGLRLILLLRVDAGRFDAVPSQFIVLAILGLVLNFAVAYAFVGSGGYLNYHALPSALFGTTLVLLAGYLIGRILRDERYTMLVPVAIASAALSLSVVANVLWLALERQWFDLPWDEDARSLYYILFAWWSIVTLVAVARLSGRGAGPLPVLVISALVILPSYYLPADRLWEAGYDEESGNSTQWYAAVQEQTLYAQPALLQAALDRLAAQRPGVEDLYFVGFAPYASQDVFMKEMRSVEAMLRERFDIAGREVVLISNAATAGEVPLASLTSLRRALQAVSSRIDREEDVVLLHLTSHGSSAHELSVQFWPLQLDQVRPIDLRAALDDAGIKWRIVVVSACYSGGFIETLKDPHTLVITAADAAHTSFGCSNESDFTYFSKAYFDEALRRTWSFQEAFAAAKDSVRERELREELEPSNPQIFVGEAMSGKLSALQKRLGSQAGLAAGTGKE